jgi:hypothetical protein
MAFSRTAPRHEISYLRRVPKVGETPAPAPAPRAAGPSLSLGGRASESSRSAPAARRAQGRTVLSRDAPAVTLDRRQSAIGSLAFELAGSGELSCAWELVDDGDAGLVSRATGVAVSPEFGRRPIVQLVDRRIIVGLRHVRKLRRLLLLAGGLPNTSPSRLVGDLHGGGTIESPHTGVEQVTAALAIYQVDGELVVRREDAPFGSLEKAAAAYGFSLTWLPPLER